MSQEFTYSDISEHNTKKVSRSIEKLLDARKRWTYPNETRNMRVLDNFSNPSGNV